MGQLRRAGQEDVLHHEVVEALQQPLRPVLIGLRLGRILADGVERAQLAVLHGLEHLGHVPPVLGLQRHAPGLLELGRTAGSVVQSWNPTRRLGIAPMSPPPCTLFWPRSGFTPEPYLPDMAGEQRQVDQREDVVHRVVVLGDAEGPADLGPVGPRVGVRRPPDHVRRNPGLPLGDTPACSARPQSRYASNPVVARRMNASLARPAWMISRAIALESAMSDPTLSPSHSSAHWADAVRRGSTT